jgi:hypothetical protein
MTRKSIIKIPEKEKELKEDDSDYFIYPENEDIYIRLKESDLDPDDISKVKKMMLENEIAEDIDGEFYNDETGSDLDVPGSELDDDEETYGNEDEENNYYSLGGDDHNDLDEDHDDL